jgi:hypothetical protein
VRTEEHASVGVEQVPGDPAGISRGKGRHDIGEVGGLALTIKPSTAPVRLSAEAVIPLRTVDPVGPLDDLAWLDQAIGDSRVVAIGESAQYNREFFQLRHHASPSLRLLPLARRRPWKPTRPRYHANPRRDR